MGTLEQAGRGPASERPGFRWRVFSPIGAVLLAFAVLVVAAGVLQAAPLSDDAATALLQFGTSLLLLVFALRLRRGLPAHERRLTTALKGSLGGAIGMGIAIGAAIVVGAGVIIFIGQAIDPVVKRRLDDMEEIGTVPWQLAHGVRAGGARPARRGAALPGPAAAGPGAAPAILAVRDVVSCLLFASAHLDSYVLWPRAIALVLHRPGARVGVPPTRDTGHR